MPQFDDPTLPVATAITEDILIPIVQDGVSAILPGDVLLEAIGEGGGGGGGFTGNEIDSPNDATPALIGRAFSDNPSANVIEARLAEGDDTLLVAMGADIDPTAEGFVSALNTFGMRIWDGGTQDGTVEPGGMANGELMFYVVEE
jgi:hypothetical protein